MLVSRLPQQYRRHYSVQSPHQPPRLLSSFLPYPKHPQLTGFLPPAPPSPYSPAFSFLVSAPSLGPLSWLSFLGLSLSLSLFVSSVPLQPSFYLCCDLFQVSLTPPTSSTIMTIPLSAPWSRHVISHTFSVAYTYLGMEVCCYLPKLSFYFFPSFFESRDRISPSCPG